MRLGSNLHSHYSIDWGGGPNISIPNNCAILKTCYSLVSQPCVQVKEVRFTFPI